MNQKRNRSVNWDEEEKQLFCRVLQDYSNIIENKSLNTNSNKIKNDAWGQVHKKFNELNCRHRELNQLKIQWKGMKVNARKSCSAFKRENLKTGGGPPPATPNESFLQIKDLLNPGELLRDHNIYDSDGHMQYTPDFETDHVQDGVESELTINQDLENSANVTSENTDAEIPIIIVQEDTGVKEEEILNTPKIDTGCNRSKKALKRKLINTSASSSKKDLDYVSAMIKHSKKLKDEEHCRRMQMAEELHEFEIKICHEKLTKAIMEREIVELKKKAEQIKNKCHDML